MDPLARHRLILNICVLLSVLFLPWWATIALMGAVLFSSERAFEVLFWGLLMDVLYGTPQPLFFNITFLFTFGAGAMFVLAFFIKRRLIFYS